MGPFCFSTLMPDSDSGFALASKSSYKMCAYIDLHFYSFMKLELHSKSHKSTMDVT